MNTINSIVRTMFPYKLFLNIKYFKIEKLTPININTRDQFFNPFFIDSMKDISIDFIINKKKPSILSVTSESKFYNIIIE